jgi:hypothetical protein
VIYHRIYHPSQFLFSKTNDKKGKKKLERIRNTIFGKIFGTLTNGSCCIGSRTPDGPGIGSRIVGLAILPLFILSLTLLPHPLPLGPNILTPVRDDGRKSFIDVDVCVEFIGGIIVEDICDGVELGIGCALSVMFSPRK